MSTFTVIGLGPVPSEVVKPVLGKNTIFIPSPTPSDFLRADAVIVRASFKMGESEFERMPHLKVIARTGVGVDDIDTVAASRRGIPVAIVPGANTHAVAEGAFAQMLHLTKNLAAHTDLIRENRWADRQSIPVGDLEGATLGIIGYGRIGQRVATLARAFDMQILAYDPVANVPSDIAVHSLSELLAVADIISLHLPLLESTRYIIDAEALSLCKRGALLINVSRGGLIDQDAALEALNSGQLAGLGLDSFEDEPIIPHPLYQHPATVLTPHIMGLSKKAAQATFIDAAKAVRTVLDGYEPFAVANPDYKKI